MEEELVDAATAARTIEELDAELLDLKDLTALAREVRASDTDKKWSELRTILEDETLSTSESDTDDRRKLIVFTEHRDTLTTFSSGSARCSARPEAVTAIHGGVSRVDRREIVEEFTQEPGLPDTDRHRCRG